MTDSPFVHLHVHTEFSLLDGAIRIDRMLQKAQRLGMESVAITDHGNMLGCPKSPGLWKSQVLVGDDFTDLCLFYVTGLPHSQ